MCESPQYVQTSLAAAITLKLARGRFMEGVELHGLNLLLTYATGCVARCSYCGLAQSRQAIGDNPTFIRVDWPAFPLQEVLERTRTVRHALERACVSMVTHPRAFHDCLVVAGQVRSRTGLLVSVLLAPPSVPGREGLQALRAVGVDKVSVAVDAATPALFDRHRGSGVRGQLDWDSYWRLLEQSVEVFGRGNAGVHLIVGLGETEQEMVSTIQKAHDQGAATHLFSFFPEEGSALADSLQPGLGTYRRVQLARLLIDEGILNASSLVFNQAGQIADFGLDVVPFLQDGRAFTTSGCAGPSGAVACNRPYGNERPSRPFRNFPFKPTVQHLEMVAQQLGEGLE